MAKLEGKKVIVTGASSGMGRATALLFAREGADVAVIARRRAELESTVEGIADIGRNGYAIDADLARGNAAERAINQAIEKLGQVDAVIHAAGTNIKNRALSVLTPDDWDMMVGANLNSAFHVTRAVVPHLRARGGGLIVYVSSGAVQKPDVSGVSYQATKHAVVGLAHGTMQEEKANGIRTTVIFPGLTDTPLILKRPVPTPPEVLAKALHPEDIAEACLFVASLPARAHVPELILLPAAL